MADTFKTYLKRNLKNVIAKFGDVALLDEIAESNLANDLKTKINGKAEQTDVTALSNKVTTLIGTETGDDAKSARAIASEEVAKIVANADESFDTLKEIADWISTHSSDATEMNSAIVALKGKTVLGTYVPEGETDPVEYATVKAYVEAYVAEQIASNITLNSLSVATATGTGNVVTGLSYDPATGAFTPSKGITALTAGDISGSATGDGNVVTGFSYDEDTGAFTANKGNTAVMEEDLVDLTDAEIDALFGIESSGD